jgi:hypothetical protein
MSEKQDIVISTSILLKAPRGAKAMAALRDRIARKIKQATESALSSEAVDWNWECTNFRYLEDKDANAHQCFYCSKWATDRSKLDPIDGLIPGCELDGRWVCNQCIEHHDKTYGRTTS